MVRLSAAKIRNGFNHALLVDPELAQLFQPKRVDKFKILDPLEGGDEAVYAVVQDEQLLLPPGSTARPRRAAWSVRGGPSRPRRISWRLP